MLFQLVLLGLFYTIAADPINKKQGYEVDDFETVGQLFEKFMKEFNRSYTGAEKFERFQNFVENVKNINELNNKFEAEFDINHFTDMSKEEKAHLHSGLLMPSDDPNGDCQVKGNPTTKDAPAALDWRDKNAVSPIKDQGNCGSCWAFSATALVESRYWVQGKKHILSEQQMVDCDKSSAGCGGGLMTFGLTEVMNDGGQESDADYPYEAQTKECRFDKTKVLGQVKSCTSYGLTSEDALKELLFKEGPLAIAVAADNDWFEYKGGIFDNCDFKILTHGVLLVGYGSENGNDYWIIKNSWGKKWGENGFIRLKRGQNCAGINDKTPWSKVSAVVA